MAAASIHIHDDYAVGLVCALPRELAAATAMLDEIHDDLPTLPLDNNIYTLGTMGSYNVVISCCPPGLYGTKSAATVAIQMISTFHSIRFRLMVGIGSGVPNKEADIWLGDVVVSIPTAYYGGVVQFDHGKTTIEGQSATSILNKPPQVLLKAVAKLQADRMLNGSQILAYLSQMASKNSGISSFTYQR